MKGRGPKGGGSLRLSGENALAAFQARGRAMQTNLDRLLKPDPPDYAPYVAALMKDYGLAEWEMREDYKPHPTRGWEIDFAWPYFRIGLEVDGGIFTGGAHGSIQGKLRDLEKHNALLMLDWRVIHCIPHEIANGVRQVAELIKRDLSKEE